MFAASKIITDKMKPRNINPFTDFGFKKLFGEEASKDILIDFLNAALEGDISPITDIEFSKNEHHVPSQAYFSRPKP